MVVAMNRIEKHAAFYRGYLADDRSLAAVAMVLLTAVAFWLIIYLVSLAGALRLVVLEKPGSAIVVYVAQKSAPPRLQVASRGHATRVAQQTVVASKSRRNSSAWRSSLGRGVVNGGSVGSQ